MLQAEPAVIAYIIGCGLLALLTGVLVGYALCRWVTDRKLRRWLVTYGQPVATKPPKPRRALSYYV